MCLDPFAHPSSQLCCIRADVDIRAPAHGLQVNGQVVTHFLSLEELMDDNVGQEVELVLERGGKEHRAVIKVGTGGARSWPVTCCLPGRCSCQRSPIKSPAILWKPCGCTIEAIVSMCLSDGMMVNIIAACCR
jgi:hypothetical protein